MPTFVAHTDIKAFIESHIKLPGDKAQEHRDQVNRLRERLEKHIADNPEFSLVKMLHSGSVAKGTALRTVNDLDVAVYVRTEDSPADDDQLIPWLAERLRESNPQKKSEDFIENQHSVTVCFKGTGLNVDVVPVLYESDDDDKGHLVQKDTGSRVLTSIPLHLSFVRKRKDSSLLHFVAVVRLVKWWAKLQKDADPDDSFKCKSFLLELLVAHLADQGLDLTDYPEALNKVLTYIVSSDLKDRIAFTDYYKITELPEGTTGVFEVFDPVNPDNNVCSGYSEADRKRLIAAAEVAADAIEEANYSDTKGRAIQCWQRVLGSSFRG